MNYREATDALFSRVIHKDLAERLGVSVALVRQSMLDVSNLGYRNPPQNWAKAVVQICKERAAFYSALSERLRSVDA